MMLEYSWLFGMNIDNLGTLKERRLVMQVVLLCYRESLHVLCIVHTCLYRPRDGILRFSRGGMYVYIHWYAR